MIKFQRLIQINLFTNNVYIYSLVTSAREKVTSMASVCHCKAIHKIFLAIHNDIHRINKTFISKIHRFELVQRKGEKELCCLQLHGIRNPTKYMLKMRIIFFATGKKSFSNANSTFRKNTIVQCEM